MQAESDHPQFQLPIDAIHAYKNMRPLKTSETLMNRVSKPLGGMHKIGYKKLTTG